MKINVLITAAGSAISQGILKAVKTSSLECNIITTDSHPYAAGLYRGKAGYLVPLARESNFIEQIVAVCNKENVHAILIGTDYELSSFARNRETIEKETGARVIVSPTPIIDIADDKWLTHSFLVENNLPSIPSALRDTVDELVEQEGFPLIVKPRIGDSSKDTFIVQNEKQLLDKLDCFLNGTSQNPYFTGPAESTGPIIQKYLPNSEEEYTSTTVVLNGKSYGVLSLQREMRFGGHTTKAVIDNFPFVNQTIERISEVLNPFGPCNFQSRLFDGIPHVFEINARFSGTTAICAQVGFNTVEACLRSVVLNQEIPKLSFRRGVMLRYFNELFIPKGVIEKIDKEGSIQNPDSETNDSF